MQPINVDPVRYTHHTFRYPEQKVEPVGIILGDNQINSSSTELTVIRTYGLTGLHRRVRLGMHCKVGEIAVDPTGINTDNS